MLTNNFTKLLMLLNGNQPGVTVSNEQRTLYMTYKNNTDIFNICYKNSQTSKNFIKEVGHTFEEIFTRNDDNNAFNLLSNMGKSTLGILVGTGNTVPTSADISLAKQIVLESPDTDTCTMQDDSIIMTRQFINNTDTSITISEVGLYAVSGYWSSTSWQSSNWIGPYIFLLGRELLEQPVELQVGDTGTFTYKLTFKINEDKIDVNR